MLRLKDNKLLRIHIISNFTCLLLLMNQHIAGNWQTNQIRISHKYTFPKDLLMLAWNARVGYSFDKTLSHPFVAQAGIRSH